MLTDIFLAATFVIIGLDAYSSIRGQYCGKPLYRSKAVGKFLDTLMGIFTIGCLVSFILEKL